MAAAGNAYPFRWNPISDEVRKSLLEDFAEDSLVFDCLESDPGKVWMTNNVLIDGPKIYNFELRPDDVWVVTYPKCGTTWTQEILWLLLHKADFSTCKPYVSTRSPFLEYQTLLSDKLKADYLSKEAPENREKREWTISKTIEFANRLPSPRLIKCHLPLCMLPPKLLDTCKVVYVARHPMDVCVSYYHHTLQLQHEIIKGDFSHFAKRFRNGQVKYGSYLTHLQDAQQRIGHPNFKLLWYEDMKKDLVAVIKDLAQFVQSDVNDEQMCQMDEFLSFANYRKFRSENPIKNNKAALGFFRKGQVGDWTTHVAKEHVNEWNAWITSHFPRNEDIKKRFLVVPCNANE